MARKTKFLMVRTNDAERDDVVAFAEAGGWRSYSDLIRDLIARAQSQGLRRLTEQSQPDHQHGEPQQ